MAEYESPLCYADTPKVTFKTHAPVFLIGVTRSGTTILRQLLRKYLDINFGTEGKFITRLYKKFHTYGNLAVPTNLDRLLADLTRERCFMRWREFYGFRLDVPRFKAELQELTCRAVVDAVFQQFADFAGRVRWGDKTPSYIMDLPVLATLYPEAQYIHIIRDGRDVALSLQKLYFGPKNPLYAGLYWKKRVHLGRTFGACLPASQYYELRYEDLLQNPTEIMIQLARFVQIDSNYDVVIKRIQQQIAQDVKSENFFKWKHEMTEDQIRKFEKVSGDLLKELGYEVSAFPQGKIGYFEKTINYLDDRIRYYSNPAYTKRRLAKLSWKFRAS
jgi:hypothetical protein